MRHRIDRLAAFAPVEHLEVEIDAEHERQNDERGQSEPVLAGPVAEREEQGRVHQHVRLGIQIAAEYRHAP